jgi:hypothetical protein
VDETALFSVGATGAAPKVIRDNVGIPIELALAAVDTRLRQEGIRHRGSLVAADLVMDNKDVHAFNIAGGLHHAMPDKASGFCIFNDPAITAAKPDAVIFATGGVSMVNAMKAAKATGFAEKIPMFIHTATELSTLAPLGMDAPEGILGTSNYHFYYPDTPKNKAFVKAFKDAYGREPKVGALYGYLAAQFITKALQKAGKMDKEKFIDALSGLKVDSPIGEIEMRAYDHQAMLPMYMGVTKKVPEYPFLIAGDIVTIPAKDAIPSVEEVKKARGQ